MSNVTDEDYVVLIAENSVNHLSVVYNPVNI